MRKGKLVKSKKVRGIREDKKGHERDQNSKHRSNEVIRSRDLHSVPRARLKTAAAEHNDA